MRYRPLVQTSHQVVQSSSPRYATIHDLQLENNSPIKYSMGCKFQQKLFCLFSFFFRIFKFFENLYDHIIAVKSVGKTV